MVDARTWTALFKSNVSFVGGGGKTVMTVYNGGGGPRADGGSAPATTTLRRRRRTHDDDAARGDDRRRSARRRRRRRPRRPPPPPTPRRTAPRRRSRSPTTPAAPVAAAGGCGAGQISAPVSGVTTGVYGEARSGHTHAGKDIAAPTGTAVRAAQCGTVTQAGADGSGYGNLVCIQHAGGVSTCYAHLSAINTTKGAYVHVGDVIGKVGCTGTAPARTSTSRSARTARP